jgi:hypothetical protein
MQIDAPYQLLAFDPLAVFTLPILLFAVVGLCAVFAAFKFRGL